jgi:hypothetical protein
MICHAPSPSPLTPSYPTLRSALACPCSPPFPPVFSLLAPFDNPPPPPQARDPLPSRGHVAASTSRKDSLIMHAPPSFLQEVNSCSRPTLMKALSPTLARKIMRLEFLNVSFFYISRSMKSFKKVACFARKTEIFFSLSKIRLVSRKYQCIF